MEDKNRRKVERLKFGMDQILAANNSYFVNSARTFKIKSTPIVPVNKQQANPSHLVCQAVKHQPLLYLHIVVFDPGLTEAQMNRVEAETDRQRAVIGQHVDRQ